MRCGEASWLCMYMCACACVHACPCSGGRWVVGPAMCVHVRGGMGESVCLFVCLCVLMCTDTGRPMLNNGIGISILRGPPPPTHKHSPPLDIISHQLITTHQPSVINSHQPRTLRAMLLKGSRICLDTLMEPRGAPRARMRRMSISYSRNSPSTTVGSVRRGWGTLWQAGRLA